MSAAILEVEHLDLAYRSRQVLFGVSITVAEGSRVALLGTNGAGKSSLLKAIAGLVQSSAGCVRFAGEDVTDLAPEERAARGLTLIEGGRATFASLTVLENLRMGAYPWLDDKTLVARRLNDAIATFPILGRRLKQRAGTLSGGEQQMLALGRALMADPRLLIVDELSLGLAPAVMQEVVLAVDRLVGAGRTLLLVEQSVNVAAALTDHAFFLEKGAVCFSGATSELLTRGDLVRSVFFRASPAS